MQLLRKKEASFWSGKATPRAIARSLSVAAAAALMATAAQADVTYLLEFSGATLRDDQGTEIGTYDGAFSVTLADAVTARVDVTPSSCSLSASAAALLTCGATQTFDPSGFSTGKNYIGFNTANVDGNGSGTGFLWFDAGSFTTNGVHSLYTDTITDGSTFYGSFAAAGTLTVSGVSAVPEPGTVAMMGLGLAALAFARRRAA